MGEDNDIETRDSTCCSYKGTRQYIKINQSMMASTLETTTGEPGVMMSRSNQTSPSHQATISYHTLGLSNCCSIKCSPLCDPVIRLTQDAAGQGEQVISRPVTRKVIPIPIPIPIPHPRVDLCPPQKPLSQRRSSPSCTRLSYYLKISLPRKSTNHITQQLLKPSSLLNIVSW